MERSKEQLNSAEAALINDKYFHGKNSFQLEVIIWWILRENISERKFILDIIKARNWSQEDA